MGAYVVVVVVVVTTLQDTRVSVSNTKAIGTYARRGVDRWCKEEGWPRVGVHCVRGRGRRPALLQAMAVDVNR